MIRVQYGEDSPRIRTTGQVEEMGYRLLVLGIAMLAAGLLSSLTVVLLYPGLALLGLGAFLIMADIAWMFAISREMTEEVVCPECLKRNRVRHGIASFPCDDCGEAIKLQPAAQAVDSSERAPA
jgi:hypothetical protein